MRYLFYMGALLLCACQHVTDDNAPATKGRAQTHSKQLIQDGAPKDLKSRQIRDVKPVVEAYSRYGNPDLYLIDGKKYEILRSSQGYKARGVASWYGTKFHDKRTSSGDPYNMYAMTAAHKTLPLPSYVRVKNLDNGKTVVVRINDRGPFRHDRLIDLSYAAASKLGLLPKGTAHVEVEALRLAGAKAASYYIQAAAYSKPAYATAMRDKIKNRLAGASVFVEKYKDGYVVRLGPIASQQSMNNTKRTLIQMGFSGAYALLK